MKELSFDVRFNSVPAYDDFGEGKQFTDRMREIYQGRGLVFPDEYESTLTSPPVHFIQVSAPDELDVEELRGVAVPGDIAVEIRGIIGS